MHASRYALFGMTGALLIGAIALSVGLAQAQPASGAKVPRSAATGPSPEETRQKQLPPPAKPEQLRAPTQADMENACFRNPKCRAKLEQAKQGKRPAQPLPAATEPSPEEKLQKSLPPPAQGRPPMGPRSHLPSFIDRFFAWLNPFTPYPAWAQTGFAVTVTPHSGRSYSPYAFLALFGGHKRGNDNVFSLFNSQYTTPYPHTENKPHIYVESNLPADGFYLIDVHAHATLTKLRHKSNGRILETWDYRNGCGSVTCHYVTVDYYSAGLHYWYFWADPTVWGTHFYSITIKSYP